jgi:hypothetical protein
VKTDGSPAIKAHLLRGAFYLLLLLAIFVIPIARGALLAVVRPEAPVKLSHPAAAGLTFAQRVAYQRAIEEVYWRHRIWPRNRVERPDPKPSLAAVMSQAQLEKKVHDYLRKSRALEDYWQQRITGEQLQKEIDRMAQQTKQPEVLREIFAALGNDSFVIAECLARPVLAERTWAIVTSLEKPLEPWQSTVEQQMTTAGTAPPSSYAAPLDYLNSGGRYNPAMDAWELQIPPMLPPLAIFTQQSGLAVK